MGALRNLQYRSGNTTVFRTWSITTGEYPPETWYMPTTRGEIMSVGLHGGGGVSLTLTQGMPLSGSVTGSGSITTAAAILVVSAYAALSGSGDVTLADFKAYLAANATLSGSGSVTAATVVALGWIDSVTTGAGVVSSSTPYATGELDAMITGYSALSPEGIRDTVWNAALVNYAIAGSTGAALSAAGGGGVTPPTAEEVATAVWADTTGAALAIRMAEVWGRLGLDINKPLVTDQTSITFGQIVMAMTGDSTSTTVTRQ